MSEVPRLCVSHLSCSRCVNTTYDRGLSLIGAGVANGEGELRIPHWYVRELCADNSLTVTDLRLLLLIIDETLGWQKDRLTTGQGFWRRLLNKSRRATVIESLQHLEELKYIRWVRGNFKDASAGTVILIPRTPRSTGHDVHSTLGSTRDSTLGSTRDSTLGSTRDSTPQSTLSSTTSSTSIQTFRSPHGGGVFLSKKELQERAQLFGQIWQRIHRKYFHAQPPVFDDALGALKKLAKKITPEEYREHLIEYFKDKDPFVGKDGFGIMLFCQRYHKYGLRTTGEG